MVKRITHFAPKAPGLTVANAEVRKRAKKAKNIQKPKYDADNHDGV